MGNDVQVLSQTIQSLSSIAGGYNPFTNVPYDENGIANDPRVLRCLYHAVDVLKKVESGEIGSRAYRRDLPFVITPEQKARIKFPADSIGVNTMAKYINEVLDSSKSKYLTGMHINGQLKKMGILSDECTEEGRHQTVINSSSAKYGIETMDVNFNGRSYKKVVFNNKGKEFILQHLEEIMGC